MWYYGLVFFLTELLSFPYFPSCFLAYSLTHSGVDIEKFSLIGSLSYAPIAPAKQERRLLTNYNLGYLSQSLHLSVSRREQKRREEKEKRWINAKS